MCISSLWPLKIWTRAKHLSHFINTNLPSTRRKSKRSIESLTKGFHITLNQLCYQYLSTLTCLTFELQGDLQLTLSFISQSATKPKQFLVHIYKTWIISTLLIKGFYSLFLQITKFECLTNWSSQKSLSSRSSRIWKHVHIPCCPESKCLTLRANRSRITWLQLHHRDPARSRLV